MERFRMKLTEIPAPGEGSGCHGALLGAANLGVFAGLGDAQIHSDIQQAIPAGSRPVPDQEIAGAIKKARHDHPDGGPSRDWRPQPTMEFRPQLNGGDYRQVLIDRSQSVTRHDIMALSPEDITEDPVGAAMLTLDRLFAPDELLFIGDDKVPGRMGESIKPARLWIEDFDREGGVPFPKLIVNPLSGLPAEKKSGDGPTLRGDGCVERPRFMVVEFDDVGPHDQLSFWHSVIQAELMPVAALVGSGGKSLHAWLQLDLPDLGAWDQLVKQELYGDHGRLTKLGADRQCCNPARLSRMPGHYRASNNRLQRLVYLHPRRAEVGRPDDHVGSTTEVDTMPQQSLFDTAGNQSGGVVLSTTPEVVMCKDCRHFEPCEESPDTGFGLCRRFGEEHGPESRGEWARKKHRCPVFEPVEEK